MSIHTPTPIPADVAKAIGDKMSTMNLSSGGQRIAVPLDVENAIKEKQREEMRTQHRSSSAARGGGKIRSRYVDTFNNTGV